MKTVPLHGKNARGRVALVDDGDYELVMQYRWFIYELPPRPGRHRNGGPYAVTSRNINGQSISTRRMHCLIMGVRGIDHKDHNGLNNQRSNLRPATQTENNGNSRPSLRRRSSQYKGVYRDRRSGGWVASIRFKGRTRRLGTFAAELEAAYTYDSAARDLFGEYACPNFPEPATQAMRDAWDRQKKATRAIYAADQAQRNAAVAAGYWARREPTERTCTICGQVYLSKCTKPTLYCGDACKKVFTRQQDKVRRERKRQRDGRLF